MRAADVIMTGNDVSTMFVVDEADTTKLVSKEKVAISSDVISIISTCTSTVVVCSTSVVEFLTERPVTPTPIVSALYSAEESNTSVQVLPTGQVAATVTDVAMVLRVVQNVVTGLSVVPAGDRWGRDAQWWRISFR